MLKIYLAGSCSNENRNLMMEIATFLRRNNYEVLAPFEYKVPNEWSICQESWARDVFEHDCEMIKEASMVLVITPGRNSTAGTNWEQGYAYGLGKLICVAQIGDEPTSLMTYNGCNYFMNIQRDELGKILDAMNRLKNRVYRKECKGVLT